MEESKVELTMSDDTMRTSVEVNGCKIPNLRDVIVRQSMEGGIVVTVEFLASSVNGPDDVK